MKTTNVLAALLAALLLATPPAGAAVKKAHKKAAKVKIDPAAQKLMAEGLGALSRGEYSSAIASFNKAVRAQGGVSSYFLLGWAHYQRGFKQGAVETADRDDAQSALDAYALALRKDPTLAELPDRSKLYFSQALCYEAVESYDRALSAYKSALTAAPEKALIPLNAARLRLKMKDEAKAMSNLEMALAKARKSGREQALIDQVRASPAYAPIVADRLLRRRLGLAAPEQDGTMVAATGVRGEELRDAVRDAPRAAPPAQDPAVLDKIAQGNAEFNFRRYPAAVAAYNEALAIDRERATLTAPQTAAVYEKIGAAYNKLGQSDVAIRSLQKSLQVDPMSASAHYQIASAYAVSGKTGAALHALKECFSVASSAVELRRLVLLAKTDTEFEAVRDQPAFAQIVGDVSDRIALR